MSDWYYSRGGLRHGPVSAKQLVDMSRTGRLLPGDQVSFGNASVDAASVTGLLAPPHSRQTRLRLVWEGRLALITAPVSLLLDGKAIGGGSVARGCDFTIVVATGRHTLTVRPEIRDHPERTFDLDMPLTVRYTASPRFSYWMWNVEDVCPFFYDISDKAIVDAEWQLLEDSHEFRCPHCGAEWAVANDGEEVVRRRNEVKTVSMMESEWLPCPYTPNLMVPVPMIRKRQAVVIVSTVHRMMRCEVCRRTWNSAQERECVA